MEIQPVKDIKGKKKASYKSVRSKRKNKGSVDLLINGEGKLIMGEAEKAEVLNAFFTSVVTKKVNCQMMNRVSSKDRSIDNQPSVGKGHVRD